MQIRTIIIILLIFGAIGYLVQFDFIETPIVDFLEQKAPWSVSTFNFVKTNVVDGSLMGLLMVLMFVNIPLLPSPPAEAYVLFTFAKGANIFGIFAITVLVYIFFALIYYFIGRFYGQKILEKRFKRPIGRIKFLDRYMGPLIFIAYLLPIPIPIPLASILVLFSGSYKTDIIKIIAAVGMATLIRFGVVVILYLFYQPLIEKYLIPIS